MKPSERIALITESARLLATREWTDLDLILRQHKMPTSDFANNDAYSYVIEMIDRSDDADLRELHSYLVGQGDGAPNEAQPWEHGHLKLFMSHLAIHQEYVGRVDYHLSFDGVSAFVAHTSIEPSREWQFVIETALRSCDAMVVFLHAGFHESNWCDQEVGFALARRIPVMPISIDTMPYGFMSKFQAMKVKGVEPKHLGTKISEWLSSTPTAQAAMTDGLITAFNRSDSYDRTRRLMTMLQKMSRFTPAQLDRLDDAARTNDQVKDANLAGVMVPDIVQTLIIKHGGTTQQPGTGFSDEPPF